MNRLPIVNLEELQDHFQLTDTDAGVVYQALENTDLYELLSSYIETVDYRLYLDYANRIVIGKYYKYDKEQQTIQYKDSLIKKAVYYALKGEEYNLRTLINSTNFEYDPLNNYMMEEEVKGTTSIGAYTMYGEHVTNGTTSYGSFVDETVENIGEAVVNKEISKPEYTTMKTINHGTIDKEFTRDETLTTGDHTDTLNHIKGSESDIHNTVSDIGTIVTDTSNTSNIGERNNSTSNENKVSAYNTTTYQPKDSSTGTNITQSTTDSDNGKTTVNGHTDTVDLTDTFGERQDKDTNVYGERIDKVSANNTEKTVGYVDSETFHQGEMTDIDKTTENAKVNTTTTTHNPRSVDNINTSQAHRDDSGSNENESRTRNVKGNTGIYTLQSMIQEERALADLNISEKIIDIIIHALCEGVLYVC